MKRINQGRAHVLTFDGLTGTSGRLLTTAIIAPPDGGRGELHDRLERAIDRLGELDDATAAVKRDAGLNELEREKRVAPKYGAVERAVEATIASSRAAQKVSAERRAKLLESPQLSAEEVVRAARNLAQIDAEDQEAMRVLESAAGIQRVLNRAFVAIALSPRLTENRTEAPEARSASAPHAGQIKRADFDRLTVTEKHATIKNGMVVVD